MVSWLLDGSALLVGRTLLLSTTGHWTPLSFPPEAYIAPGTEGRTAALVMTEGEAPYVQVVVDQTPGPRVPLPEGVDRDGYWALALVGEEVYVHTTSRTTWETSCWNVRAETVTPLPICLEASFLAIDHIRSAGPHSVVVNSHGEGHPGVDLLVWDGEAMAPVPLPWRDLYPFGPLELLPRTDGSFDIQTRCPLGPERPCLRDDGSDTNDLPALWYRWTPGQSPVLRTSGAEAEVVPDPSSERVAWIAGTRVCVGEPTAQPRCHKVPRRLREAALGGG